MTHTYREEKTIGSGRATEDVSREGDKKKGAAKPEKAFHGKEKQAFRSDSAPENDG
jgi:hypothetical protein